MLACCVRPAANFASLLPQQRLTIYGKAHLLDGHNFLCLMLGRQDSRICQTDLTSLRVLLSPNKWPSVWSAIAVGFVIDDVPLELLDTLRT